MLKLMINFYKHELKKSSIDAWLGAAFHIQMMHIEKSWCFIFGVTIEKKYIVTPIDMVHTI